MYKALRSSPMQHSRAVWLPGRASPCALAHGGRWGVSSLLHLLIPFHPSQSDRAAAGNANGSVEMHGRSYGTASGVAPRARIAMYKALWRMQDGGAAGMDSDIQAAVDTAVADGVDVLSLSLGSSIPNYFSDIAYLNAAKGAAGMDSDIRAAVDTAVADGVDVLSLSLGGSIPNYFSDVGYLKAAKVRFFRRLKESRQ
ncbi:unnamed protein product, partial [Closterium sp. NIES-53]